MSDPRDNLAALVNQAEAHVGRRSARTPVAAHRSNNGRRWFAVALLACAGVAFYLSAMPWLIGDSESVVMRSLLEIARAARADVEANRGPDGSLPARVRDPALAIMVDYRPGADGVYRVLVKDGKYRVELNESGVVVSPTP